MSMDAETISNCNSKSFEDLTKHSNNLLSDGERSDQFFREAREVQSVSRTENIEAMRSATFAAAMSFHSILEGIALGVQDDKNGIITLFTSLIIHKGIEAFSVGLQICKSSPNNIKLVVITIFVYAMMTPIGSLVGAFINNADIDSLLKEGIVTVLESLAVGTFIYVTFFEVIATEKANEYSNLVQLLAIVIGFSTIALLQYVELRSEIHPH